MGVKKGADLPGGGKLPGEDEYKGLAGDKTLKNAFDFSNNLESHKKECDGKVEYVSLFKAH